MNLCRHDRCHRDELHEAHDEDFVRARNRRRRKDLVAKTRPKIVRTEKRPDGPYAFVKCPECSGGGCVECQETGEMSLFRWHLWKREHY